MSNKQFLVICRVGDNSLHKTANFAKLEQMYPQLNLSKKYKPNKFRLFSNIKITYRAPWLARQMARLTRKQNIRKYDESPRFGDAQ